MVSNTLLVGTSGHSSWRWEDLPSVQGGQTQVRASADRGSPACDLRDRAARGEGGGRGWVCTGAWPTQLQAMLEPKQGVK